MSCPRPQTARSDPKDIGDLHEPLRSRIYTVVQDAPDAGLVLVSGLRDPGRQWDLRRERCPGRECDPACRGFPVTAVPATWNGTEWVGGSNHQRGDAADMGGRALPWLIDHRAEYGLGLTVRSENWHFEAEGRDVRTGRPIPAPTRRIIPWPGSTPPAPSEEDDDMPFTEAQLRKIVREEAGREVDRAIGAVWADEASDVRSLADVVRLLGSIKGWLVALALKMGVTRQEAIDNDPTHKKG